MGHMLKANEDLYETAICTIYWMCTLGAYPINVDVGMRLRDNLSSRIRKNMGEWNHSEHGRKVSQDTTISVPKCQHCQPNAFHYHKSSWKQAMNMIKVNAI